MSRLSLSPNSIKSHEIEYCLDPFYKRNQFFDRGSAFHYSKWAALYPIQLCKILNAHEA